MSWSKPKRISVGSIRQSHSVEKGRKTPARYMRQPIYVKKTLFGYKVHDGNARVQAARRAGRGSIRAHVKQ